MPIKKINPDNTKIKKVVKDKFKQDLKSYKGLLKETKGTDTTDKQMINFVKTSANCILLAKRFDVLYSFQEYHSQKNAEKSIKNLKKFITINLERYNSIIQLNAKYNPKVFEQNKNFSQEFRQNFNEFFRASQKIIKVEDVDSLINTYNIRMNRLFENKIRSN